MLFSSATAFASEVENKEGGVAESQVEDIHYLTEDLTRGSKKPSSKASVHNLGVNNYNFQLTKFGYKLFTDKWLTSRSGKIKVNLTKFKAVSSSPGATKNEITFHLYDSSGRVASSTKKVYGGSASKTFTKVKASASKTFTKVKAGKKYYVAFEVPTNGNKYSGSGYISD